jgi:predicted benzoate:H+ symporter BenE
MIYPDFIGQAQSIFYPLTISGLLHHSVSLYLSVLMIVTGFFQPTIRKFYIFPLGMSFYMTYGVFLMDCVGLEEAMYIHEPLIEGTIFTWYFVGFLICVITAVLLLMWEFIKTRKMNRATADTH